jgi:intracellular sulfur oxidation DsrE/DsrF family protein
MENEIDKLRIELAQGIMNLTVRTRRLEISVLVLQKAIAALSNPENPEVAFQQLLKIEEGLQKSEVLLQDNRELLEQIRKLQKKA